MYRRGRFDVFEDDNVLESPGWHGSPKNEHRRGDERDQTRKEREEREPRRFDERERDESRRGGSGPLVPERVLSSIRGRDEEQDRSLLFTPLMFLVTAYTLCTVCVIYS